MVPSFAKPAKVGHPRSVPAAPSCFRVVYSDSIWTPPYIWLLVLGQPQHPYSKSREEREIRIGHSAPVGWG
jgi:hypothetical protein